MELLCLKKNDFKENIENLTLEIKNKQKLIKKKTSRKRSFQRKVKAILNLRSAETNSLNNSNSKRPETSVKELVKS